MTTMAKGRKVNGTNGTNGKSWWDPRLMITVIAVVGCVFAWSISFVNASNIERTDALRREWMAKECATTTAINNLRAEIGRLRDDIKEMRTQIK